MRKYVLLLLSLYLLAACSAPTDLQSREPTIPPTVTATLEPTLTPTFLPLTPVSVNTPIPETSGVITADNADRLTHIATWGKGNVTSAEYTVDGKYLLVGSMVGIYIYDAGDFSKVDFIDVSKEILDISVSPDGTHIAASTRGSVLIIDLYEKSVLFELDSSCRSCLREFHEITFSPDGQILATVSNDDRGDEFVQLWNVNDGSLRRNFESKDNFIFAILFSPDGEFIVTGGNATRIWNLDGEELDAEGPNTSGGGTESLVFTPDGQILAEGSGLSYIILRTLSDVGEMIKGDWLPLDAYGAHSVAVSPDGNRLVASTGRKIHLWELPSGEPILVYESDNYVFRQLIWSPDGRYIVATSLEEGLEVWDAENVRLEKLISQIRGAIHDLDWSPSGKYLAVGGSEGEVYIIDSQSGEILQDYNHIYPESSVEFSPDGKQLVIGRQYAGVEVRTIDGELLHDLGWGTISGNYFSFSQNGDLFATHLRGDDYSRDYIQVWKTENWTQRYIWDLGDVFIQTMSFSPDARWLVYTKLHDDAFVLSTYTGKQVEKLDLPDYSSGSTLVFSPGGEYLAVLTNAYDHIYLNIWHVDGWTLLYSTELFSPKDGRGKILHFRPPSEMTWSPDGRLLAVGLPHGYIKIVDVTTGEILHVFKAHTLWATSVAFSPDGQILATGSLDGTVRLWGLK